MSEEQIHLTPEQSELLGKYAEAMEEHGNKPLWLEFDVTTLTCIVAALHLAMRHPRFDGPTRALVLSFAMQMEMQVREHISPVIADVMAQGRNEAFDVRFEQHHDKPPGENV